MLSIHACMKTTQASRKKNIDKFGGGQNACQFAIDSGFIHGGSIR